MGQSTVYDWINALITVNGVQYKIIKLHLKATNPKKYNDIFTVEVKQIKTR